MTDAQREILGLMGRAMPFAQCEALYERLEAEGGYTAERGYRPYNEARGPDGEKLWVPSPDEGWLRAIGFVPPKVADRSLGLAAEPDPLADFEHRRQLSRFMG